MSVRWMCRRKLCLSQSHYCKLTHQGQHRVVGEVCYLLLPCCITVFVAVDVERRGELTSPCLFGGRKLRLSQSHYYSLTHQGAAPSRGRSLLSTVALLCLV